MTHNYGALKGRSLTGITDLSTDEVKFLLAEAARMKRERTRDELANRPVLALIFEKPSLRTRVTFEVGMAQLGGSAVYLAPSDISIGKRESVKDVAANLSRWVDGIAARVFSQQTVVDLAGYGSVPVINALSDLEHPCQALADLQTICERKCADPSKPALAGLRLVFVGDGNNVVNSLILAASAVGLSVTVACPPGYEPDPALLAKSQETGRQTGAVIEVSHELRKAVEGADIIYTDIWTSMGQESEAQVRQKAFEGYQVNRQLMSWASPDAFVLHCLPAHREEEITSEVLDGPQSAVLDQAENRLHAQKALLAHLL